VERSAGTRLKESAARARRFLRRSRRCRVQFVEELGGGLNLKRPKFVALMDRIETRQVSHLVIAHKDRLVCFGFQWVERFCAEHATELLVLNKSSYLRDRNWLRIF
jgi:predicted site-specific integrase-resolvase